MKVFVSNQLSTLSDALYEKLFEGEPSLLEKRWLIIPNEETKLDLYLKWLEKRDVITGIQALTYGEMVRRVFPELPCKNELTLRIEVALDKIKATEDLALYLKGGQHLRKIDLAEELSSLFLKYLRQPAKVLLDWLDQEGWQQSLWKEIFGTTLPTQVIRPLEGSLFFYQIEKLTPYEWKAFSQMKSWWFLFSPSQMYMGDFQTQRQQLYTLQKAQGAVREELSLYFEQDSPLLSNWGVAGRDLFRFFEEAETEEKFEKPAGSSALKALQTEWITLERTKRGIDASLQLHSAPNLLREVEVVWEVIQRLPDKPRDILVLAPDIQTYAAAIEWVFKERGGRFDYTITGMEAKTHSLFLQGLETLILLPKFRFSRQMFERLLLSPPFLKRFDLSLEEVQTICQWMREAHLRYDLAGASGSWEAALTRVMETLIQSEKNASISLDFTEIPLLNRWIEIARKLQKMLAPASDSKMRTGSEWANWIEDLIHAFLTNEEETDLLNSVLSNLRNDRVQGTFPFLTVERLLLSALKSRTGSMHRCLPQAVRFTSLKAGAMTSAKTIILMGMQEGSFPRLDPSSSLPAFPMPNQADEDRYLFLEAIAQAQENVTITYARCHSEDGKEMQPSVLVQELAKDREGLMTFHHPISALDPTYFQKGEFQSLSTVHYKLLSTKIEQEKSQQWQPLSSASLKPFIDLRVLRKLARHPVQCFFEESLGLRFERKESEAEFLFSPLEMHRLRAASLHLDPDHLIHELDQDGKLPTGSFRDAALQSIEKDLAHYRGCLDQMNVKPGTLYTLELNPHCLVPAQVASDRFIVPSLKVQLPSGETRGLQGTIEGLTEQGLLFHGDSSLEDLLKIWPIYCTAQAILGDRCHFLLLTKKGALHELKIENPQEALGRYLDYLQRSLLSPSPLLPAWGRRILRGGEIPTSSEDEMIIWAETRNLLPPSQVWVEEWRPYLQEVLHELL